MSQEGQVEGYAGHGNAAINGQVFQPSKGLQCHDLRISNCSKSRRQQQVPFEVIADQHEAVLMCALTCLTCQKTSIRFAQSCIACAVKRTFDSAA